MCVHCTSPDLVFLVVKQLSLSPDLSCCDSSYTTIKISFFNRLQNLNLTVSYTTVIRLLEKVGEDFDMTVKGWRDRIISTLSSTNGMVRTVQFQTCN